MKILTLSGWGQPHDALSVIALGATHFDYANYENVEDVLKAIAKAAENHDAVIGWSLGGQLAVRAIAAGLMLPKKLILFAVPFQFVHSEELKIGMPRDKFQKFYDNYAKNPARTLAKAWELVMLGDSKHDEIRAQLGKYDPQSVMAKNWLNWLARLDNFSCKELDFSNFPPALLLHGEQDAVVYNSQTQEFIKLMPVIKYIAMPGTGHAPHWHDAELVKKHIEEYLHV